MMRILCFSYGFPSINSRFIRDELEYIGQRHSLDYLVTQATPAMKEVEEYITVTCIPYKDMMLVRKLRWILWTKEVICRFDNAAFGKKVTRFLEGKKPDIIHCHFAYEGLMLYDNMKIKQPVIFHFHGYDASEMLRNAAYVRRLRELARNPDVYFIYCSKDVKNKLAEHGIDNLRHDILYYGIDLNSFVFGHEPAAEPFRFIHVSNLQEKKGVEYSLRAFKDFLGHRPDGKFEFLIIGDGTGRAKLEQLVKDLHLENRVRFMGQRSREEVISFLSQAHVFVHHSITASNGDQEGIPNALMEAMAIGMPVLSSYHAGISELVEHGVHGYLSPEKDVTDITERMLEISRWNDFRLKKCRDQIQDKFNKNKHVKQLEAIYQRVIAAG